MTDLLRRSFLIGAGSVGLAACAPRAQASTLKIAAVSTYAGGKINLTGLDYVIEKQGYLREALGKDNIALQWFQAPNAAVGPIVNEAFASRKIQFAGYSDLPSIILNASNTAGKTKLVVPGEPTDSYLVVPVNSTAKSIEDLKGKRLAIHRGRPWELPLLRLLQSKGLSYKDFQIYNINPDAGAAAVATGGIDALFTVSAFNLEDKGVAKVIWSTAGQPLDWKSWGGTYAARDYLSRDPELAQIVVEAHVKAAWWASQDANKDELIHARTLNGSSERIIRRTYEESGLSWKDYWSPLFAPELYTHYREAVAFARQNGIIQGDIDVDDFLDDRYVKAALKSQNLENYWSANRTFTPAKGA